MEAVHSGHWNQSTLNRILALNRGKKLLVVGDVGVDRYTVGSVDRISPEAPVPIVHVNEEKLKLGLAANVADNIQALGGIPFLIGVVGSDRIAEDFRGLLKSAGMQSQHLIVDTQRRTVLKERVVSERQQLLRIDYENLHPISQKVEKLVLQKIRSLLSKVDGVIIEDYAKGLLSENLIQAVVKVVQQAGKVIALDPNSKTPIPFYQGVTLLTPNTREAEQLSGIKIVDEKTLGAAGTRILKLTRARHVVITRGKDGMAIFSAGSSVVRLIPTYAREVYDVSGAGDTVISMLMLSLMSGATIEEAAFLGNIAAGIEVGKRGTATVSPEEIRAALLGLRQ